MSITVLLVDDHALVREALRDLLTESGDMTVVAECADGSEVAHAATRFRPDVVLMDLQMPRMGGLDATREVLAARPESRVIVLTGSFSATAAREAEALGAAGFLLKGGRPEALLDAIRSVAAGGTAWSPRTATLLARHTARRGAPATAGSTGRAAAGQ